MKQKIVNKIVKKYKIVCVLVKTDDQKKKDILENLLPYFFSIPALAICSHTRMPLLANPRGARQHVRQHVFFIPGFEK